VVYDESELVSLLDAAAEQASPTRLTIAQLYADNGDALGIVLGGAGAVLSFTYGHGNPPYYASRGSSERSSEEIYSDIRNQVSRAGFEVDVDPTNDGRVEIYVRWPRKSHDSAPPFTIPLIRETIGSKYRKAVAFGTYLRTNRQSGGTPNGSQPFRSDTNGTSSATDSRR